MPPPAPAPAPASIAPIIPAAAAPRPSPPSSVAVPSAKLKKKGTTFNPRVAASRKDGDPVPFLFLAHALELISNESGHTTPGDLWITIQDKVYGVIAWTKHHPGGAQPLLSGQDVTDAFVAYHPGSAWSLFDRFLVGHLSDTAATAASECLQISASDAGIVRNLYRQLDTIRAKADAASIAAEQTAALLEQRYAALSHDLSHLQSENAQLSTAAEQHLAQLADAQAEKHQIHLKAMGKDGEIERLSVKSSELHKSKRQLLELLEQKDTEISL